MSHISQENKKLMHLALQEIKDGLAEDEVKQIHLDDGSIFIYNSTGGMISLSENLHNEIAFLQDMASCNKVIELYKTNGVNALRMHDRCIKFYGVFLYNHDTGKTKFIDKYNTMEEAENTMKLIKHDPSSYVNEDGNYVAEIKFVLEMGPVKGDIFPATTEITRLDKRIKFVL